MQSNVRFWRTSLESSDITLLLYFCNKLQIDVDWLMLNRMRILRLFLLGTLTLIVLHGPTATHAVAKVPRENQVQKDDCCLPANRFITLRIPLQRQPKDDGTYFWRHDFVRELNRKTGSGLNLDTIPNDLVEITPVEQLILIGFALTQKDVFKFKVNINSITVGIPNSENPKVRAALERVISAFGVKRKPSKINVPSDFDPHKKTLLLVHGLESNSKAMVSLGESLEGCGYQVLYFEYGNDQALARSGRELSQTLVCLKAKYPELTISIVAHSMGGLVSRYCLETPGLNPGVVHNLFMLGTPNKGSDVAVGQSIAEFAFETIPDFTKSTSKYSDGFGEAGIDLLPSSRFLKCLNSRPPSKGVKYFAIAGRAGVLSKDSHRVLVEKITQLMNRPGVNAISRAGAQRFLCNSEDELLEGLGDGAVSIASALGVQVTDKLIVNRNHVQLLQVDDVSDEIVKWIIYRLQQR